MAPIQPSRMGFLLAGGNSTRMGTDKASLDLGGQTLMQRALTVMAAVCDRVTIVGDPAKFAQHETFDHPVVADIFLGCGPLGGIHSALVHSSADLNLMLAVDMPFVSADLLAFLFEAASQAASDSDSDSASYEQRGAIVTVPRTRNGLQPLCAIYRRAFTAVAEQALRAGNYKIDAAFSAVPVRVIEEGELTAAGFSDRNFFNVNTPQDWRNTIGEKSNSRH